jgi:hypothetical protein
MQLPKLHLGLTLVVLVALGLGIAMGQAIQPDGQKIVVPAIEAEPARVDAGDADLAAAKTLVAKEAATRQKACTEEINQVLRKHRCSIGAVVVIQPQ